MDILNWPVEGALEMGESPVETTKPELTAFKIAQYTALRDEILKRLEMQHQLIALALVASGTLVTLNIKNEISELALWLSPILIMFIAFAWSWNNVRIVQAGKFIKDNVEEKK